MPRAVVIGGGAIGVASAHYLEGTGWEVTLLDRGEIGRGCSYGNSCLIVPSHSHPIPGPGVLGQALRWMLRRDSPFYVRPRLDPGLLRWAWQFRGFCRPEAAARGFEALLALSRASLPLFEELARTPGIDFFYQRKGLLHVYLSDRGAAGARHEQEVLERAGFRVRLLSGPETLEFEPALSPRVRGGLYIEGEAHGHAFGYVRALAAHVEKRGARVLPHRAVSRIVVERGRVDRVVTASPVEELPADLVVLAAGAWTPELAASLGIRIPLQPAKGYSCTIDDFPGSPRVPILIQERRVIVTPLGDRLRFGGTLELAGYDLAIDETRYRAVVRAGREVLRTPFELGNAEAWCGRRPVTPDGLPIIARAPGVEGLIVATGHAMLGFTQSPITGKLVAELANGQAPSVPLTPFRLDRF
ncbi:MAG: FAD-dependent oxidoreductase [Candidatus Rokubacteria bacterium]|nr:FAD-dependent oxidoreductase [Candidatus Rokubacteria bacterium]